MKDYPREIILKKSLLLFNEKGVSNVSLREIAATCEMSQGNLNYHFKKKEDIIKVLKERLSGELSREFGSAIQMGANFYFIIELARKTFEIQNTYKFLIADLPYLVKAIPEIETFIELSKKEKTTHFIRMFESFVDKNYMRGEEYSGEYEELALRLFILGIYSMTGLAIGNSPDRLQNYLKIILSTCFPYLTSLGKEQYFYTLNNYKIQIS